MSEQPNIILWPSGGISVVRECQYWIVSGERSEAEMSDIFERVESPEYAAQVDVASGHRLFKRLVMSSPEFAELCQQSDLALGDRIQICLQNPTPEYANPHDHAIAAYMLALVRRDHWALTTIAWRVWSSTKLFWARYIAAEIINEKTYEHPSETLDLVRRGTLTVSEQPKRTGHR